ncbi:MAG: Na/Pi cotransporter family protein [Phycisphaeraceae bacterium]|nr:MAG: Na/Pi cotransporter family protein [Phycisphaeraceae bacterium]
MVVALMGGLGLFMLGMVLLTDGLKALAGDALRRVLTRFVSSSWSAVGLGALVTAVIQSSAATTLTTVGFVSAGLLTFTQAVGVVFGANLGTTSTGWIVSQLGFKVSLGGLSPPLVLVGVLLRLLSKGWLSKAGLAFAGFGLLFIGIDMLQHGMAEVSSRVDPSDLPGAGGHGGFASRAVLMACGFLMAVLMQSSSAAMATTLAAVASGAIGLEQAAALIVGQNIGTTPTAVAASIGGTAAAKRTALAHVLFNTVTAGVAFVLLPVMLRASVWSADLVGVPDGPTILAAFHTGFNVLGVALLFPFIRPFAGFIERLLPDRDPPSLKYLSRAVAEVGPVALESARRALVRVLGDAARAAQELPRGEPVRSEAARTLGEAHSALGEVRRFVHRLGGAQQAEHEVDTQSALLHAADHADRLIDALIDRPSLGLGAWAQPEVARVAGLVRERAEGIADACEADAVAPATAHGAAHADLIEAAARAQAAAAELARVRRDERRVALRDAAHGRLSPDEAVARIDALLWLDRVTYHLWRAAAYLARPENPDAMPATPAARGPGEHSPGNPGIVNASGPRTPESHP